MDIGDMGEAYHRRRTDLKADAEKVSTAEDAENAEVEP
jgi:hypothetical protein